MKELPHSYKVRVDGTKNNLTTQAGSLPALEIAPPYQFDGPGDKWSPAWQDSCRLS